jgi:hypothetical protein
VKFSTRSDEIIKTITTGNKTCNVYSRNGILCIKPDNNFGHLVPLERLSIAYKKKVKVNTNIDVNTAPDVKQESSEKKEWEIPYADIESPKKWGLGYTKNEVDIVLEIGELSINAVIGLVNELNVPVKFSLHEHTKATVEVFRDTNNKFANRPYGHDLLTSHKDYDLR